jgi:transcriptional regulator of acetoin/glycerol metabolism
MVFDGRDNDMIPSFLASMIRFYLTTIVAILSALASAGGNKSEAARKLKITRRTLYKKLQKFGVL